MSTNLDTRLLRFRSRTGTEDAATLARALLETGRAGEALEVALTGLEERPADGSLLQLEGESWFQAGDLLRAQAALLKAAKADPESLPAFRLLGEVLLKRGDPARAVKLLQRGLMLSPGDDVCERLIVRARRLERIADRADSDAPPPRQASPGPAAPQADAVTREAADYPPVPMDAVTKEVVAPEVRTAKPSAPTVGVDSRHPFRKGESRPRDRKAGVGVRLPSRGPSTDTTPSSTPARGTAKGGGASGESAASRPNRTSASASGGGAFRSGPPVQASTPPALPKRSAPAPDPGRGVSSRAPNRAAAFWPEEQQEEAPTTVRQSPYLSGSEPRPPISGYSMSQPPAGPGGHAAGMPTEPGGVQAPTYEPPRASSRSWEPGTELPRGNSVTPAGLSSHRPEQVRGALATDPAGLDPSSGAATTPGGFHAVEAGSAGGVDWTFEGMPSPRLRTPLPEAPELPGFDMDEPEPVFSRAARPEAMSTAAVDAGTPPDEGRERTLEDLALDAFSQGAPGPVDEAAFALGPMRGSAPDVDRVLEAVNRQGLFEQRSSQEAGWASNREARSPRLRVGRGLAVLWLLAVLIGVGGYFGWESWTASRRKQAAELSETAHREAMSGDHAELVAAERHLVEAKGYYPLSFRVPLELLFVHAQRALEGGRFSPGYLRRTAEVARARLEEADDDAALRPLEDNVDALETGLRGRLHLADAIVAYAGGDVDGVRRELEAGLGKAGDDPVVMYVAGRLKQRLGDDDAIGLLEAVHENAPNLTSAALALVEARSAEGELGEALAILESIQQDRKDHLRALLWGHYLRSDTTDQDRGLTDLEGLLERTKMHGAATDQVLHALAKARLLRRAGKLEDSRAEVARATKAGATEPRLLVLVARAALQVGELQGARRAAASALRGAAHDSGARKLLGRILIAQRNGVKALKIIGALGMQDPEVLALSAEAALLVGNEEALTAAATAVKEAQETSGENVELEALGLRLRAAQGNAREAFSAAKKLAGRAPTNPVALRALGEVAIAAGRGTSARNALTALLELDESNAEAHYLLGRAQRMLVDAEGAAASLRRATELQPALIEARFILGRLLLDAGDAEEAVTVFAAIMEGSRSPGDALFGRIGKAEALIALGSFEDAKKELESLSDADLERQSARLATALLALGEERPRDAVAALAPIAREDDVRPDALSALGDGLVQTGRTDRAVEVYERALEKDASCVEALVGRAELLVRAERPKDARDFLARAEAALRARIRPPRLQGRFHMLSGRAYLQEGSGSRDRAKAALRRATEVDPTSADAWFFLGEARSGQDAPGARTAYEKYLELAPDGTYATRASRAIR